MRACQDVQVLIICPTGVLVHAFKSKLPEVEGVERITVDTIHGVLNYKRPGPDSKVAWSPPSALRNRARIRASNSFGEKGLVM